MYWFMLVVSFGVMCCYSYWNLRKLKEWAALSEKNVEMKIINGSNSNNYMVKEQLTITAIDKQGDPSMIEKNFKDIIYYSIMAGIFSGFGLGGGLFLVPMYRALGCQPL